MSKELMKKVKDNPDYEELSIDELLRMLIGESDLIEVVCCLDTIATESGTRVASFDWSGRTYPCGPAANLVIPPPPWKLDPSKRIKPDQGKEVLVPDTADEKDQELSDSIEGGKGDSENAEK